MQSGRWIFAAWALAGTLCLSGSSLADTQAHHKAKAKKQQLPPPLPSGPRGPAPQVPLDSIPAVAPQVSYRDGQLAIVAPNSTLGDILRAVRKQTSAEIEIPPNATERVVTRLGPGPAREVLAELLNGSHFNYVLLGSPQDSSVLTRVVLVAKSGPDNVPNAAAPAETQAANNPAAGEPPPPEDPNLDQAADDNGTMDDNADQGSAENEQQAAPPADQQPGVKSPQQLLQEMQQRQMQMQQQQQQGVQPGMTGQPGYGPPPPGAQTPQRPPQEQQ